MEEYYVTTVSHRTSIGNGGANPVSTLIGNPSTRSDATRGNVVRGQFSSRYVTVWSAGATNTVIMESYDTSVSHVI